MENKELGRLVLKHVETFPETFNMGNWALETSCGTVACLAGWTLLLHGGYTTALTIHNTLAFYNQEGHQVHAGSEARMLLGLTNEEYCPGGTRPVNEYTSESVRPLFYTTEQDAIERLRAMVEEG